MQPQTRFGNFNIQQSMNRANYGQNIRFDHMRQDEADWSDSNSKMGTGKMGTSNMVTQKTRKNDNDCGITVDPYVLSKPIEAQKQAYHQMLG